QPGVQPLRLEGRVSLALAIDDGLDVAQQIGQVVFGAFASAQAEGIDAADAAAQLVHAFADRPPIPAQLALRPPLPIRPETAYRPRHEQPPICSSQRCRRFLQVVLDLSIQFHENVLPAQDAILWDTYFSGTALRQGRGPFSPDIERKAGPSPRRGDGPHP